MKGEKIVKSKGKAYNQNKLAVKMKVPEDRYSAYTAWKHVYREYLLDDEVLSTS